MIGMVYPQFKNKHAEAALFNPQDYVKWTKSSKGGKPRKYILIYYPKLLKYFKRRHKTKEILIYRLITVHKYKNIGIALMTGIGAPHAATVLEELIALGGREFLNIGSAGGLTDFGVFLCDKAIRDEGTSHHYLPNGKYSYPDKKLMNRLGRAMKKQGLNFQKGTTWTIDAPYRETKAEVKHYRTQGVKTVEMEASALFSVAKIRKVKIAAAFVVTDVLGEDKWDPQFDAKRVNQKLERLMDAAVECLKNKD